MDKKSITYSGDKGYMHNRIHHPSSKLEKAFSDNWIKDNVKNLHLNSGQGTLQDLFIDNNKWHLEIKPKDRYIVATVVQWLGSNCGFSFLLRCLEDGGYVVRRKDYDVELLNLEKKLSKERLGIIKSELSLAKASIERLLRLK